MSTEEGKIENVYSVPIGDALSGDHAAGVNTIFLADVGDFNEDGGQLQIDGAIYTYSDFDDDEDTLTITPALAGAFEGGEPVYMYPLVDELTADISIDEGEDSITAILSHSLKAIVAEGIRDPSNSETVIMDDDLGFWRINEIIGQQPSINGSYIDPTTTIPPEAITDGNPPASSPEVILVPGLKVIYAKWDPIVNNDLVQYEVHINTSSFVAVAGDAATLVGITPGNMVAIRTLADNSPLAYDIDYFIQVIARDEDGSAAPGVEHSAQMDRTGLGDIAPNSITTEMLDAVIAIIGILQVGSLIDITPPTNVGGVLGGGIVVKDPAAPNGEPLVRLHPDGCTFRGKVVTDILTVMQDLIVNGQGKISSGGTMKVENGVSSPSLPPQVEQFLDDTPFPAIASTRYSRGMSWDYTDNCWIRLLVRTDLSTDAIVQRISSVGTVLSTITLTGGRKDLTGIARAGSYFFAMGPNDATSPGDYDRYAYRYNASTGVYSTRYLITTTSSDEVFGYGLSGDPTNNAQFQIYAQGQDGSSLVASEVQVRGSAGGLVSTEYSNPANLTEVGETSKIRWAGVGDFDYGSKHLVVAATTKAWVYEWTGTEYVYSALKSWALKTSITTGSFGYRPNGYFYSSHNDSRLQQYSNYTNLLGTENWYVRYVDTGSGAKTAPSPAAVLQLANRRYLAVTLRPAPSGVNGEEIYVGYGTTEPAIYYQRVTPEYVYMRSMNLFEGKITTGPTLRTLNVTNKSLTSNVATLTANGHGFGVGQQVIVAGVDSVFNGTYLITAKTTNTFDYARVNANVSSTSATGTASTIPVNTLGGTPAYFYDSLKSAPIVNKSLTSNVATLTTSIAHNYFEFDEVLIKGVDGVFNGLYTITGTPTSTTFTYAKVNANVASAAVAPVGSSEVLYNRWKGNGSIIMPGLRVPPKMVDVSPTSVYTGTMRAVNVAGLVTLEGSISRASGADTSFTPVPGLVLPEGSRPFVDILLPASVFFTTGSTLIPYQFSIGADGVVSCRQAAANPNSMSFAGFSYRAVP